jgi:serine/threonine-protein kinase
MRRTQPGPPVAWIWAGVTVLAVLLVAVLIWVMQIQPSNDVPTSAYTVPNVVDMSYDRAVETLEGQQLTTSRVNESDEKVAAGNVVSTVPEAGTNVTAGQRITVYVSTGPDTATVPTLDGITESEARTALQNAGLSVGSIRRQDDPALAAGTIISSSVESGAEVAKGTTVNLVVASGQVVIVDYTGYTLEAAQRELESDAKQLTVKTQQDPGCKAATPPTVKTQSLAPGEVPVHSEITLTVCSGA